MSQRKEILILEPSGRIRKEAFCTRPMVCPYCNGRGWFHTNQQEPETEPCPDCQGTGEVIALVTIGWKPNNEN